MHSMGAPPYHNSSEHNSLNSPVGSHTARWFWVQVQDAGTFNVETVQNDVWLSGTPDVATVSSIVS